MNFRSILALSVCKISGRILRLLGRGGTNLPGRMALKIDPSILKKLSKDMTVTVVTGTNGKTTTSRMIEQSFIDSGFLYFSNKSGANLLTGIVSVFAQHASIFGKCPYEHALIECDEAAFRTASLHLPVKCLVVNNIFRDQLDRYGEITHTLSSIQTGIRNMKDGTLCLNADCSLTASLAEHAPGKVIWFGVNVPIYKETAKELSDAMYCIHCKTKYEYDHITYAHLGSFYCPKCGYKRPDPDVAVTEIKESSASSSDIILTVSGDSYPAHINLPGGYNLYNAAAEVAVSQALGIDLPVAVKALEHFECGFGRAEEFPLGSSPTRMLLVKNPAGFNQVISMLSADSTPAKLALLLNDRYADGTDISWIWDVDFETLASHQARFSSIIVSGIRRDDLSVRLKYAGFVPENITVEEDFEKLLDALQNSPEPSVIVPTYTAMFDLRRAIGKRTSLKAFYE